MTLLSLHPRGQGCPGSGGTDLSVSAALPSARDRQEREPVRALRDFAGRCGVLNTTKQGEEENRAQQEDWQRTWSLAGVQRLLASGHGLGVKPAGPEASPAHHPPPHHLRWRRAFCAARRPHPVCGTAFPAVPTRGHPVVRVWGSPQQLTCAEPTGPGQWAPRAGSQARGGLEALCGMGGAPAMQGQGELGEGLPRPLTFSAGPRPEPGTTPLRIQSPSDPTRGAAEPFSGCARPC